MHGAVALATSRSSSTRHAMLVLICTSVPSFMLQLDANIVSVSLPVIARSLNAGFAGIEWVITAYMLSFASLLLPAGPLPFYLSVYPWLHWVTLIVCPFFTDTLAYMYWSR